MTGDFKQRLADAIEPIAKEVARQELQKTLDSEKSQGNFMVGQSYFDDTLVPIFTVLADKLSANSIKCDSQTATLEVASPTEGLCRLRAIIASSSGAFLIKILVLVPYVDDFSKSTSFPASKFDHETATHWLEQSLIEAAKYLVSKNR